jgi:predicted nucleotide-binding protein
VKISKEAKDYLEAKFNKELISAQDILNLKLRHEENSLLSHARNHPEKIQAKIAFVESLIRAKVFLYIEAYRNEGLIIDQNDYDEIMKEFNDLVQSHINLIRQEFNNPYSGLSPEQEKDYEQNLEMGYKKALGIAKRDLDIAMSEMKLRESKGAKKSIPILDEPKPPQAPAEVKIFLVHGRDSGTKETVARFLEKLGLKPIILHEQPSKNRTVIEKFVTHSEVHFTVVLLTPDDQGGLNGAPYESQQPRARQNVILELGYFLAKLGRDKVCVLFKPSVEIPSDYQGILLIDLEKDSWRYELVKEMKAAELPINAEALFS